MVEGPEQQQIKEYPPIKDALLNFVESICPGENPFATGVELLGSIGQSSGQLAEELVDMSGWLIKRGEHMIGTAKEAVERRRERLRNLPLEEQRLRSDKRKTILALAGITLFVASVGTTTILGVKNWQENRPPPSMPLYTIQKTDALFTLCNNVFPESSCPAMLKPLSDSDGGGRYALIPRELLSSSTISANEVALRVPYEESPFEKTRMPDAKIDINNKDRSTWGYWLELGALTLGPIIAIAEAWSQRAKGKMRAFSIGLGKVLLYPAAIFYGLRNIPYYDISVLAGTIKICQSLASIVMDLRRYKDAEEDNSPEFTSLLARMVASWSPGFFAMNLFEFLVEELYKRRRDKREAH